MIDASQEVVDRIRRSSGDWLYHYTTLETALVHILPRRRLRLSPFSLMRDPRESKAWVPSGAGYLDGVDDTNLLQKMADASERVNHLRNAFKLLSLTLDGPEGPGEFERGYARSRLWELYAERGAGVCVVLNRDTAIDAIARQLEAVGQTAHRKVQMLPPARDDDVVASVRKSLCQRAPDSGRRARDEDGVAREVHASSRPERTTTLPD